MFAELLNETRGCTNIITPEPADPGADALRLLLTAHDALGDLLALMQDGAPDLNYAELLSRLGNVVGRAADVAKQTADTLKDVDGEEFASAREKTAATVPGMRSDAAYLQAAAGHAEDGQDQLAAPSLPV
ncbi:hypothetical protein ACLQ2R_17405 [Streptosporangium sp. DT93]|uniref:hypothetical protein n=1 Tax=Streptosporangium sp. DT93 TaxID=3393428 RepID=UPI003CE8ABFA